jgi:hypothetical protein
VLNPAVRRPRLQLHAEHPIRENVIASQELEQGERIEQTQIIGGKQAAQSMEYRGQLSRLVKVHALMECVPRFAPGYRRDCILYA